MQVSALSVISVQVVLLAVTDAVYIKYMYYFEPDNMECRSGEYMSYIGVVNDDGPENRPWRRPDERQWEFRCHKAIMGRCSWTDYVHDFDEDPGYGCRGNKVIAGMNSDHGNNPEERRFSLKCCDLKGKRLDRCYYTSFGDKSSDKPLSVSAPPGTFFKLAETFHDKFDEKRLWAFLLCH